MTLVCGPQIGFVNHSKDFFETWYEVEAHKSNCCFDHKIILFGLSKKGASYFLKLGNKLAKVNFNDRIVNFKGKIRTGPFYDHIDSVIGQ